MQSNFLCDSIFRVFLCICSAALFYNAAAEKSLPSYASTQPLARPAVFAPGVISQGDHESHPAFTGDGADLYFLKNMPDFSFWTIMVSHFRDGHWSEPEVASFSGQYSDADPFITVDGSRLYFISNRPISNQKKEDLDIWYMDRAENGWGEPKNAGTPINSPGSEWYPTMAADGTLYFGSDRAGGLGQTDLYRCKLQDGKYQNIENLGEPVNSKHDEYEPWISPDQSFLLFMAIRPDGQGRSDLYLSHNENGKWSPPINLGSEINSSGSEYSPKITPDGKYFFFTSTRGSGIQSFPSRLNYPELLKKLRGPGNGLGDIYSVDVSILPVNKR